LVNSLPIPSALAPVLLCMLQISPALISSMHYDGNPIPSLLTCTIYLARHNDLCVWS
jgi:hypothetical protein